MGIVVIQPLNFLSILGKKLFGGPVEKTPSFSLFPFQPNMKHPPKSFPSSFSLPFFFIIPKIHSTKHTLKLLKLHKTPT